ncbi:MAG TPA: VCBS repeat-containing protein, partial [Armatimonadota bacterium]|nr:VCBS repeat-containing protein [Armatimonadota bacterium]
MSAPPRLFPALGTALSLGLLPACSGCGPARPSAAVTDPPTATTITSPAAAAAAPQLTARPLRFTDVTQVAGIDWRYSNGGTGRHLFAETTGGGVAFLDYNRDGRPDLFALQGGPVPGASASERQFPTRSGLFRNNGDGTFTDVTARAGLDRPTGYGQGVSVADYDNDGWPDLYLTAYGGCRLFRNGGNGTFTDVTARAGVGGRASDWPLSAAWGDYNRDGHLDLFVCHYVRWSPQTNKPCEGPNGGLSYCRPQVYEGSASRLYRSNGDGTFTDVSGPCGIARLTGKSMGATWVDYDEDGYPDLFVTNDTMPNFLLHNNRNGTFSDVALAAGVAVGATGNPMS